MPGFTAAQAAQKCDAKSGASLVAFTAAQAAQKCWGQPGALVPLFTAAQAAQKLPIASSDGV